VQQLVAVVEAAGQAVGQVAAHPHHLEAEGQAVTQAVTQAGYPQLQLTDGAGAWLLWPVRAVGFGRPCDAARWLQPGHAGVLQLLQARGLAVGFAACAARTVAVSWRRQPLDLLPLQGP
jgi:hypothetical protein